MEDADYPGLGTHEPLVCAEIQQGVLDTGKKKRQQGFQVYTYQRVELMGHCKYHMVIRNALNQLRVPFQFPLFPCALG